MPKARLENVVANSLNPMTNQEGRQRHSTDLGKHVLKSYSALRWAMATLGFSLPPFLVVSGIMRFWWLPEPLPTQTSLSAYYHAGGGCLTSYGVYRNLFIGFLCVIAACLIIYSGFSRLEDWLLNAAGVSLLLVALFPTSWSTADLGSMLAKKCGNDFVPFDASTLLGTNVPIHYASAILFFLFIALANISTAYDSVKRIQNSKSKHFWVKIYGAVRWIMPIGLLISALAAMLLDRSRLVLAVEWGGIYAFSFYWAVKSVEILKTGVDYQWISGGRVSANKST